MRRRICFYAVFLACMPFSAGCAGDADDLDEPPQVEEEESAEKGTAPQAVANAEEQAPSDIEDVEEEDMDDADNEVVDGTTATGSTMGSSDAKDPEEYLWVFSNGLSVRSGPSYGAKRVKRLAYGDKVPVLGRKSGWIRIGDNMFVPRKFVTSRTASFSRKRDIFWVKTPDIEVKASPHKDATVVGRLTRGERVVVTDRVDNGWMRIGQDKFVKGEDLTNRYRDAH